MKQNLHGIVIMGYQCERCNHVWVPRKKEKYPIVCPKCKSPYWDKPTKQLQEENVNVLGKDE